MGLRIFFLVMISYFTFAMTAFADKPLKGVPPTKCHKTHAKTFSGG